jgi:glycosyltransferase involved in cell wall biosynthesis
MPQTPALSIIIPAHNEENRLGPTLRAYLSFFNQTYGSNYEIWVVLNNCQDNTQAVVQKYAIASPTLKYLSFPKPIGKGGAIVKGYQVARGQLVAYVDADNSAGPQMLQKLVQTLRNNPHADCAAGSRNLKESQTQGRTLWRKFLSKGFSLLVNLLFWLGLKDTQCGAKVIRQEALRKVLPRLTVSDLSFDVNLLLAVKQTQGKILEVPIVWTDDHNSTIKHPLKTSLGMFLSILKLRLRHSWLSRLVGYTYSANNSNISNST